jgi:hypothetical protein
MGMRQKNIELHIEELVLHGFKMGDRFRISEAVESELARLFAERGVPQSLSKGGEIERIDGGAFDVARGSKPEVMGAQTAKMIYGGLNK